MKAIGEEEARLTDYLRWPIYPDRAYAIEQLRRESWANLRRRRRKIAVFKALAFFALTFLICGSAALVGYAISG
jgi:hypothetical protein